MLFFLLVAGANTMTGVCQGGTLVEYDGKLRLLEIAQVPKDRVSFFDEIRYYSLIWHAVRYKMCCMPLKVPHFTKTKNNEKSQKTSVQRILVKCHIAFRAHY